MKIIQIMVSLGSLVLSFFIKRKDNRVVFGSWCGKLYIDNSKYLMEELIKIDKKKKYEIFWVGETKIKEELPENVKFLKINKIKSIPKLLSCKYMFCTQMHNADISIYNVYRNAIICNLDHGIPIKKWAMDSPDYKGQLELDKFSSIKKIYYKITSGLKKYDYFISCSESTRNSYLTALKYRGATLENVLLTGTPRNDYLYKFSNNNKEKDRLKDKYSKLLGFSKEKKIVMYLPTYRRSVYKVESLVSRDRKEIEELKRILNENDAILLEKNHFVSNKYNENQLETHEENLIKIKEDVNVQELLLISDILISDYSGCCLDFLILKKPILYYIYDYEYYKKIDSGLYYGFDKYGAGDKADSYFGLLKILSETFNNYKFDKYKLKREEVLKNLLTYEKGNASNNILNKILGI